MISLTVLRLPVVSHVLHTVWQYRNADHDCADEDHWCKLPLLYHFMLSRLKALNRHTRLNHGFVA